MEVELHVTEKEETAKPLRRPGSVALAAGGARPGVPPVAAETQHTRPGRWLTRTRSRREAVNNQETESPWRQKDGSVG